MLWQITTTSAVFLPILTVRHLFFPSQVEPKFYINPDALGQLLWRAAALFLVQGRTTNPCRRWKEDRFTQGMELGGGPAVPIVPCCVPPCTHACDFASASVTMCAEAQWGMPPWVPHLFQWWEVALCTTKGISLLPGESQPCAVHKA